jgi:hypothetical protein
MERPTVEFREVVVDAEDAADAKVKALSTEFDELQLDDWDLGEPAEAKVYDVIDADPDEPLTPIAVIHLADDHGLAACGQFGNTMTTKHRESVTCKGCLDLNGVSGQNRESSVDAENSADLGQIVWSVRRHEQDGPSQFHTVYLSREAAEAAIAEDLKEWPGLTRLDYEIQDHQVEIS